MSRLAHFLPKIILTSGRQKRSLICSQGCENAPRIETTHNPTPNTDHETRSQLDQLTITNLYSLIYSFYSLYNSFYVTVNKKLVSRRIIFDKKCAKQNKHVAFNKNLKSIITQKHKPHSVKEDLIL